MTYSEAVVQVTNLYNLHLGRNPDSAGLNYWANALSSNQITLEAIASQISDSPEAEFYTMHLQSLIQAIYWAELGRLADAPGMSYYLDALRRRLVTEADIRNQIRGSQEAISYRSSLPIIPNPDPRVAAMRTFDASGVAIVESRRGDNLKTLAQQAYNSVGKWWVIAQANDVMSDYELSFRPSIKIPDIRQTQINANAVQIGDNGQALLFVNRITGDQWAEYYTQAVSLLEPLYFEPNPNWLRGLAFVDGNFKYNTPDDQYTRSEPFLLMPPEYWYSIKDTGISVDNVNTLSDLDWSVLNQLPVFSPSYSGNEPILPTILNTPGGDPNVAINNIRKLPTQVIDTLRITQVRIVAVNKSMVEYHKELENKLVPGGDGRSYNEVAGGYDPFSNTVTFATGTTRQGSASLFEHELGHAYDEAMGKLSLSPMFEEAFHADFIALKAADTVSDYYTRPDAESPEDNPTYVRAQGEAYSESFANYYTGKAYWFSDKPALLKYFQSLPRPVQPGGR